ncbi:phosphatidylinositol N-acetylglucosaminyltransferase [Panus rudis PR-1116 ss-1]|nr:phosphatidylinositol N-acetylglucosaminyltransferase [Panus rudis PR-1116 ss-1]
MSDIAWDAEWERVLWKRKSYPDNFVPSSFLASLSRNANFRPYTYWRLVTATTSVVQHVAVIFIFLAVFVRLRENDLDPRRLVWLSIGGFVLGYTSWELLAFSGSQEKSRYNSRAKAVKSAILVFLALLSLSPVLRTLTAATSSDSIWALSACLFIVNVLLADYSTVDVHKQSRERLTSVMSMNAAISSSVVLASRLPDDLSVFALTLFAIQSFSLFPILRRHLQGGPNLVGAMLTLCLTSLSLKLTAPLSTTVTYLYGTIYVFIMFVAPGLLMWAQRYKNELRGTWDVAVPRVNRPTG